jgi:hypothetical protein
MITQDNIDFLHSLPLLGSAERSNKKVQGPTYYVGSTKEEAKQSCRDAKCLFLPKSMGGTGGMYRTSSGEFVKKRDTVVVREITMDESEVREAKSGEAVELIPPCFAQNGTPSFAQSGMIKRANRDGHNGMLTMLAGAMRSTQYIRGAVNGNLSTAPAMTEAKVKQLDQIIRSTGLGHILFDHAWRDNPWILKYSTASLNGVEDFPDAVRLGARVMSLVVNDDVERKVQMKEIRKLGAAVVRCPAEATANDWKPLSCQDCGKCDVATRKPESKPLVITFVNHGNTSDKRQRDRVHRSTRKWLKTLTLDAMEADEILTKLRDVAKSTSPKGITLTKLIKYWSLGSHKGANYARK